MVFIELDFFNFEKITKSPFTLFAVLVLVAGAGVV
jgi:hypothetical protein